MIEKKIMKMSGCIISVSVESCPMLLHALSARGLLSSLMFIMVPASFRHYADDIHFVVHTCPVSVALSVPVIRQSLCLCKLVK